MTNINKHLALLGKPVEDRVTKFKGIVTSVSFDLYGCIQAVVNPGLDADGKPKELNWYDVSRLVVTGEPVMDAPNYAWTPGAIAAGDKGPSEKPALNKV